MPISTQKTEFHEIIGVLHDDPPISDTDKSNIRCCTVSESQALWKKHVSISNQHFMLMSANEWPSLLVQTGELLYSWQSDWNENNLHQFSQVLHSLPINPDGDLYIFWKSELCVVSKWRIFCDNWINFLYEDEGCILLFPSTPIALIFSNGLSWVGVRSVK